MTSRISPASSPFSEAIQARLDNAMPPGAPPLVLFTTLARDERLFHRFMAGGLLDRGHLTLRRREIVIDRTTALCGSEYEWGVHVSAFGKAARLTDEEIDATTRPDASENPDWNKEDRLLIRLCDVLHARCDVDDALWTALAGSFPEEAVLELLLLAGFYHTVSYLSNALRLPLEPSAARFPA